MPTPAQLPANHANSQLSTGPVSPEGKGASARNHLTHGFHSATVLLPGDDPAEYDAMLAELSEHFGPNDLTEIRLIREMADAEWRLRRVRRQMESAFSRHIFTLGERNPGLDADDLESHATETLQQTGCCHAMWLRYETKFERQYDRAYLVWQRYQREQRRHQSRRVTLAWRALSQSFSPASPVRQPAKTVKAKLASNVQKRLRPEQNEHAGMNHDRFGPRSLIQSNCN